MMPAVVPTPGSWMAVIAIGTIKVWPMPAAAVGIADPAHLVDVRGLAGDLTRLRKAVRHGRRAGGGQRGCTERCKADNESFQSHGCLPPFNASPTSADRRWLPHMLSQWCDLILLNIGSVMGEVSRKTRPASLNALRPAHSFLSGAARPVEHEFRSILQRRNQRRGVGEDRQLRRTLLAHAVAVD